MAGMEPSGLIVLGRKFSLFTLVGAVDTAAHYLLLMALVELAGTDPMAAPMAEPSWAPRWNTGLRKA